MGVRKIKEKCSKLKEESGGKTARGLLHDGELKGC
jgi:hypothetical protein